MAQVKSQVRPSSKTKRAPARERVLSPFPPALPHPHTTSSASRPSPVTQKRTASPSSHGRQAGRPERRRGASARAGPPRSNKMDGLPTGLRPARAMQYIYSHIPLSDTPRARLGETGMMRRDGEPRVCVCGCVDWHVCLGTTHKRWKQTQARDRDEGWVAGGGVTGWKD